MSETNLAQPSDSQRIAQQSHSMQLVLTLFDAGLIPRGKFSWIHIRHDAGCPALSGSALDCRCDCEAEIGGCVYLFSEIIGGGCP